MSKPIISRPGIKTAWLDMDRYKHEVTEVWGKSYQEYLPFIIRSVKSYIDGESNKDIGCLVDPVNRPWPRSLCDDLRWYSLNLINQVEIASIDGAAVDTRLASSAFSAFYTSVMLYASGPGLEVNARPHDDIVVLHPWFIPFICLGIVLGIEPYTSRLAPLERLSAIRFNRIFDISGYRPESCGYMTELFASNLGMPSLGKATAENKTQEKACAIHEALFDVWKLPECDVLTKVFLALCDLHTKDFNAQCAMLYPEFTRFPVEILAIFKMREKLGLTNPALDHPLMNSPLSVLPAETAFLPDKLVSRARAKLVQDGYDEEAIYDRYVARG